MDWQSFLTKNKYKDIGEMDIYILDLFIEFIQEKDKLLRVSFLCFEPFHIYMILI